MFFQHLVHWAKKYWAVTLSQPFKDLKSSENTTLQVMEPLAPVTIILEQSDTNFYLTFVIHGVPRIVALVSAHSCHIAHTRHIPQACPFVCTLACACRYSCSSTILMFEP
jgi:hypothetical protein